MLQYLLALGAFGASKKGSAHNFTSSFNPKFKSKSKLLRELNKLWKKKQHIERKLEYAKKHPLPPLKKTEKIINIEIKMCIVYQEPQEARLHDIMCELRRVDRDIEELTRYL